MVTYLTLAEVLAIHQIIIARYGGHPDIRDMGALESALMRPQSGYYETIIEEASALMESLAINHPFVDGNKRVAFAVTDVFLRINGYMIAQLPDDIYMHMMKLFENKQFEFKYLKDWLTGIIVKKNVS